jgi:magnesium chelatase subunit I
MEEKDIQIRGYRIRLPLDMVLIASANPEDYTSRGRIITPLKDRYGSQIRTHYPKTIEDEISIMEMEHRQFPNDGPDTYVPQYMAEIIAEVTHLARKSTHINQSSGVSARVSIANYETLLSNAVRRAVILGETSAVPRISDLPYIHASTIGKIEMESFDCVKESSVIDGLIQQAVLNVFNRYYPSHKLKDIVADFNEGLIVEVSDAMTAGLYVQNATRIGGMADAVKQINSLENPEAFASAVEFILEGLHLNKRLIKTEIESKMVYRR